jgi:hypothetical protein
VNADQRQIRRMLVLAQTRPAAPVGVQLVSGALRWEEPSETAGVTHYLVRVGSDTSTPRYKALVGQTAMAIAPSDTEVWVSSWNEASGVESPRVYAGVQPSWNTVPPTQPVLLDWSIASPSGSDYETRPTGIQVVKLAPTLVSLPTGADFIEFWLYKGATPPVDVGLWEKIAWLTAPGPATAYTERPTAAETWCVCATTGTTVYGGIPETTTPYRTISITALAVSVTFSDFNVTATPLTAIGPVLKGKFALSGTLPTDPNRGHVLVRRRWRSSGYADPSSQWMDVFTVTSLPWEQTSEYWDWPVDEWLEWAAYVVDKNGVATVCSPVVQMHLSAGGKVDASYIDPTTLGAGLTIQTNKLVTTVRQLLLNSDFEFWTSATAPKDWLTEGTAGKVTQSSSVKYSGDYAAKVEADGAANNAVVQQVSVRPGLTLRLSSWVYNDTPTTGVYPVINWFNSAGTYLSSSGSGTISIGVWMESTVVATAPANAAYARVYPTVVWSTIASGQVYVDQVTLSVLEPINGSSPIARSATGIDLSLESTEFYVVGGKLTQYGVDFSKAIVGKYSGSEFEVSTGAFRIKELAATKITTGILSVGGPSMVSKFAVFDVLGNAIGWVGDDSGSSGYVGAWFKQARVGGTTPAGAKIAADISGNVAIVDATFSMTKGVTYGATTYTIVTTINPAAEYNYTVGMKVEDASGPGVGNNGAGVYISPTAIYWKRQTTAGSAESVVSPGQFNVVYSTVVAASLNGSASGAGVLQLDPGNVGGAGNSLVSISGQTVLKNRQSAPTAPPSASTVFIPSYIGGSAGATYGATEQGLINSLLTFCLYADPAMADLKTKVNDLITSLNSLIGKLNTSGHGLTA